MKKLKVHHVMHEEIYIYSNNQRSLFVCVFVYVPEICEILKIWQRLHAPVFESIGYNCIIVDDI